MQLARQLEIIHLSDIHFGDDHRFIPPQTPDGDRGSSEGMPKLLEKLQEDFAEKDPDCQVIVCITGDITTTASYEEFEEAEAFIRALADTNIYGRQRGIKSIFIVPGNHDVDYTGKTVGQRWQPWVELYNRLYGTAALRENPWALAKAHDLIDEIGAVVLCLNTAIHVQKDTPSERRGEIDEKQLLNIKQQLAAIPQERLESSIRIALMHHHPLLIPALAEPKRGYDAVLRSEQLLTILHRFGFHLLLHGHKHYPLTFLDDINVGFLDTDDQPIMVVAGGSAGSTGLPDQPKKSNCYNRITVKWHPAASQARIRVATRGLSLYDGTTARLPGEWHWETIKEEDKSFYKGHPYPEPKLEAFAYPSADQQVAGNGALEDSDKERKAEYARTRGNLPVVEVMPSLKPKMAYEARCWLVPHNRQPENLPIEVIWSAGKQFPVYSIRRTDDENFCGVFNYWGPMLIEGTLKFADGAQVKVHVYARLPVNYQLSN
ncbi:MAG: metallophosphoesterase family protein [Pyrinomonadaceae bacterium]